MDIFRNLVNRIKQLIRAYVLGARFYNLADARVKSAGFTMIELLVVVAISAVVTVTGFVYLGGYRSEQNLKLTANEILTAIKNTQANSASQQDGKKWGIRFTNPTSSVTTGSAYSVFSGTSFAAGTVSRTYSLGRNISFSNPWTSSTIDTIFNAVTGFPSQPQVISLVSGRGDGMVNDIIMNSLGQIISKLDTGLVGYWHLDENTLMTAYDASGMGNNGMASGTLWISGSNCKAGTCVNFNDPNKYILISTTDAGNVLKQQFSQISILAWIYPTSYVAGAYGPTVISNTDGDGWAMRLNNGYLFVDFRLSGGNVSQILGSLQTQLNTWTHLAITYDGSVITGYMNGQVVATTTGSGVMRNGNTGSCTTIGNEAATCTVPQGSEFPFLGRIDEVRVYKRALSATEIMDQYNALR